MFFLLFETNSDDLLKNLRCHCPCLILSVSESSVPSLALESGNYLLDLFLSEAGAKFEKEVFECQGCVMLKVCRLLFSTEPCKTLKQRVEPLHFRQFF